MAGKEQAHKLSPAPRQLACIHCWCSRRHSHGSYVDVHAFCHRGQQHTEAPDYDKSSGWADVTAARMQHPTPQHTQLALHASDLTVPWHGENMSLFPTRRKRKYNKDSLRSHKEKGQVPAAQHATPDLSSASYHTLAMLADVSTNAERLPITTNSSRAALEAPEVQHYTGAQLLQHMSALGSEQAPTAQGLKVAWPNAMVPAVMQSHLGTDSSDVGLEACFCIPSVSCSDNGKFILQAEHLIFLYIVYAEDSVDAGEGAGCASIVNAACSRCFELGKMPDTSVAH